MAPIQGHLLLPKAMRIVNFAVSQAKSLIRTTKRSTVTPQNTSLNPIRSYTHKPIAIHPIALLKQCKLSKSQTHGSRLYSTSPNPTSKCSGPKYNRSSFPTSCTSRAITQKGAAPFASTLRPNLTGGTLPRSAGGYGLGGAGRARQFSHTSGCQAQVVQNVSAGIRAFFVGGSKARFDGVDPVTGEKRWRAVTETQNTVYQKWESAPRSPKGTSLEFQLSPTITALLPKTAESESKTYDLGAEETTLNSPGVLHTLSGDFARALRDLALITHDLKKLSAFGSLPLTLNHTPAGPTLSVRFPGCDGDAVSALCNEADIRRGMIVEDVSWAASRDAEMALLFPFAPTKAHTSEMSASEYFDDGMAQTLRPRDQVDWRDMPLTPESPHSFSELDLTPAPSSPEGYESLSEIYYDGSSPLPSPRSAMPPKWAGARTGGGGGAGQEEGYEGVEGIYRFLQEIEGARRR